MKIRNLVSILTVLLSLPTSGSAYAEPLQAPPLQAPPLQVPPLQNPGFEGAGQQALDAGATPKGNITGEVAAGWADNSGWADIDVRYGLDTVNPHSGQSAQRIELTRASSYGAVQLVHKVQFSKNHIYRFTVWLKGSPGQSVQLSLRQETAPYKTYASATAALGAEWRPYQVWGQVTEDAAGYLMIRASSPMTFWVDDASFEDLTGAKSNAAPQVGNILPGGSFEAGLSFGWSGAALWNYTALAGDPSTPIGELRPHQDKSTAAVGGSSLRFDLPANAQSSVSTPVVQTNFGRPHTFSLWVKASHPNTSGRLALGSSDLSKNITIGTEWQRISWTFTPPLLAFTRLSLTVWSSTDVRTIWMDGAQLEEKPDVSPQYVPDAPYEMTLQMARFGNFVFDGEAATAQLKVAPAAPADAKIRLSYQSYQKSGGSFEAWRTVSASGKEVELPAFNGQRGIWKLRATLVDGKNAPLSSPFELVWSRLPRPKKVDPQNSPFGIHLPMQRDYLALAEATGHKWNRLHDLSNIGKWSYAEWDKGQWRFDDEAVNLAKPYGIRILGMLDGAPARVTTKPRGERYTYNGLWNIPDAPGALDEWRNYVRTVTTHYKGRIDDWEVWNEPWGTWFLETGNPNATPQLYGQLLGIAYEETKKANPQATVIGIDTFPGRDEKWTIPALKASGNNPYDVFSFHDYNDTLYGTSQPRAFNMVRRFDELQRQTGEAKPQWMTEGGAAAVGSMYAGETGGLSPAAQPAYMVRYDVAHLAAGTRRIFLYSVRAATAMGDTGYQATEHDGAIRPILAARAVLASLVDGAGQPVHREFQKGVDRYDFPAEGGKQVSVLWAYDNAAHQLPVPKGVRALDVWGNELRAQTVTVGYEPIYFVS
jgi:hypothetical protein